VHGIQSWVALPEAAEEVKPDFFHHRAETLPVIEAEGKRVRLIAGSLFGETSPVRTFSEMFYADVALSAGAKIPLQASHEERAIYVAEGTIDISCDTFESGRLLVFRPGDEITVTAVAPSRLLFLGGEPMEGPRHIWWNFVSSSRERIEQAKEDWAQKRFDIVPGDVLLAVNGKPLSRPDQLQTVWDSLRTANAITAQLWRGKAKFELAYTIDPPVAAP